MDAFEALINLIDDNRLMSALVLLAFVILVVGFRSSMIRAEQTRKSKNSLENDRKIRSETYDEASRRARSHMNWLERRDTNPIVIEIIHDTDYESWDPFEPQQRDKNARAISYNEAFEVVRRIENASDNQPIYLILHTLGGYTVPCLMMADAISRHKGPVIAFVPYIAMSGGTILALAADQIWMRDIARLGPVDTQYAGRSGHAYQELGNRKKVDTLDDSTIMSQIETEKYDKFHREEIIRIAASVHKKEAVEQLTSGEMSHSHAISKEEAEKMGLKLAKKNYPSKKIVEHVIGLTDETIRMIVNHWQKEDRQTNDAGKPPTNERQTSRFRRAA